MSIRWIRNVVVDGKPTTLEVMLGANKIADKCYIRVNQDEEFWFRPTTESRDIILRQGIEMLKSRFEGKSVQGSNGASFGWH